MYKAPSITCRFSMELITPDQSLSKSGNAISDGDGKANKPSKWGRNQVFATAEALQFYLSLKIAKLNTHKIWLIIFREIWCNLVILGCCWLATLTIP